MPEASNRPPALRRVLTFWPLLFYGLGLIVGAGIYVAIGTVVARAGTAAPVAFLLAGGSAALTGLCYAELSSRFPEASGAVAYVRHGFGSDRLALLVGAMVTAAAAISAASITRGAITYLVVLVPVSPAILVVLLSAACTAIAAVGVEASVGIAGFLGVMEILGLIMATAEGLRRAPALHLHGMLPLDLPGWTGAISGAFIAFFAFTGFESLTNMAEETTDPGRTIPRSILGAITASAILYVSVAMVVVLNHKGGDDSLLGLFRGAGVWMFALLGFLAVANGALVQIVMLARLFYGMASRGQLPRMFARIHPSRQTPVAATIVAGCIVMAAALAVPFEHLLSLANALTLTVFILVALALWWVRRHDSRRPAFAAPPGVPLLAAAVSLALLLSALAW